MRKTFWTFVLLLGLSLSLSAAAPQGKSQEAKNKSDKQSKKAEAKGDDITEHGFEKKEIQLIRDWFSDKGNLEGLPPGLAKRETLPPWLQRQLKKNGTLPPGLQKRVQPLPKDLAGSLPELPTGLRRGIIGNVLVLIEENSDKIIDMVAKIF